MINQLVQDSTTLLSLTEQWLREKRAHMPAVTVSDVTVLPRVIANPAARVRRIKSVTTAPQGFEGEGFPVRRAFAGVDLADLDPFIHLDQMGEVEYAPGEPKGTPWHPHRGFETVTYIIDGIFDHRDNHGGGGTITNGDTQWMTAGAGILHIETPPEHLVMSGGLFHGFQLWVNLPAAKKWSPPAYQDLRASDVALLSSADGTSLIRVIAGEVDGHKGPGSTQTPITIVHATIAAGAELRLPWRPDYNALVYTLNGRGTVGENRQPVQMGQLAVLTDGDTLVIQANNIQESRSPEMDVLILGGEPIRESVAWMGPFVMNTKAEVLQAFEDFQKGVLGTVPADHLTSKPLNRSGEGAKLGGDIKNVHNTPDGIQEK
jgi:redox-sensitive bicupin YhaK (pirin superfamily)